MVLHSPRLVGEQIASFAHDGFLIVRDAFDQGEIAAIAAWSDELAARPEESGKHWVYHEKSRLDPGRRPDLAHREHRALP